MDTFITVTVVADSEGSAEQAIQKTFQHIETFGNRINFFSDDSELTMINRSAGVSAITVSSETLDLIDKSLYVARKSGGAFDPTIGAVMKLWDFHKDTPPTDSEIKENLPLVDYRLVKVDKGKATVFLAKKGMMLDLGGIAKGYAADLAVNTLKQAGISAGIVAVAGDIRTFGLRPDGKPWKIGIKNPRQTREKDDIIGTVRLFDRGISTAGDYERYFIYQGRRYHHILDPRTGYPAGGVRSVSVTAGQGVWADGFDNAVFVLGPQKGLDLVKDLQRDYLMDAMIIDGNGEMHSTPGLQVVLNK